VVLVGDGPIMCSFGCSVNTVGNTEASNYGTAAEVQGAMV